MNSQEYYTFLVKNKQDFKYLIMMYVFHYLALRNTYICESNNTFYAKSHDMCMCVCERKNIYQKQEWSKTQPKQTKQ
jgi:hypothetical protein